MATCKPCFVMSTAQILSRIDELSDILETCVNDGASVSFMLPFTSEKSRPFWMSVAQSVDRGERIVLGAQDAQGVLVGTVQLIIDQPENQPHRADVAKLLVHTSARRGGVARELMNGLERCAHQQGKTLLVLDTATGSGAELFYHNCGWQKVGVIPDYAKMPDGTLTGTTLFYKTL
ncbi:GCN5-related N-acetyltransferase [Citrobacter europaeus]|uniref:GNAT family N-acetyltransferase n=2 Tax=Citrobacter europaeus TaxID=1914243 RepID=UPI000888E030|nr:GNAT family N-acetyltransferase [Citrobacter europaeus]MBJ8869056.1 GNAT family N-acetyltransferase [Citrobacter braakii]MBJ8900316.1 GNAT family N-acetyltransferase [Citrobacter braakii]MBJ8904971.1 GNAT family N-acetyltransferase [Citrobacter braakii]MBJ8920622.1 GNAT family N-acetyltransferase [Citrobacter braakii]MBY1055736.1 GNAT family N-acetyltransferase [Citrobacter europaeus]